MFRHRIKSTLTEEEKSSSLTNGNASIIIAEKPIEESVELSPVSSCSPITRVIPDMPRPNEPITVDNMSAMIAAAVQVSSASGVKSSLSLGHASIIQGQQPQELPDIEEKKSVKRRFSVFGWKKIEEESVTSPVSMSTSSSTSSSSSPRSSSSMVTTPVDDGLDDLVSRGIQIKEIKTTLKPMVIPKAISNPMPEVKLERPGFAKISY